MDQNRRERERVGDGGRREARKASLAREEQSEREREREEEGREHGRNSWRKD